MKTCQLLSAVMIWYFVGGNELVVAVGGDYSLCVVVASHVDIYAILSTSNRHHIDIVFARYSRPNTYQFEIILVLFLYHTDIVSISY